MKRILLFGLLLLTSACMSPSERQTATPTSGALPLPTETLPPTPIPASQTLEPTPTLEPSPTPLPRFFTSQFDTSSESWVILQAGNVGVPNVETKDSALRLQMDSPYTWLYAIYGAQEYTNVHIETEFINSALSPASAGLVCRYSETDGWLEYNVLTDRTYNVLYGRWLDNGIADYLPIMDGSSNEIKQSGELQQIGLTCSGTILYLYINGTLVRSVDVSRYELNEGKVGISASSFEHTPVIAVFDWVTVRAP
ncbi:MAG TPA: hypothetical protein VIS72_02705 [Anaerolineales bacterium]